MISDIKLNNVEVDLTCNLALDLHMLCMQALKGPQLEQLTKRAYR